MWSCVCMSERVCASVHLSLGGFLSYCVKRDKQVYFKDMQECNTEGLYTMSTDASRTMKEKKRNEMGCNKF